MRVIISPKTSPNSFIQQSGVTVDPDLPISFAFGLVCQDRGWKIGSKRWRKAWNACMNAEYNRLIGSRLNSLETWRELCAKVGITEVFPSITKCKKALAKVNVNIVDLLDCWDTPNLPKQFKSRHALSKYTRDNHKFFGRAIAKQDKALKALLRQLV